MNYLKIRLLSILAFICVFGVINIAWAEQVVIKRDLIFIADRGLTVKDLHTGALNQCAAPPLLDPAGSDVTGLLATATDVAIKHDYAVVTIHPLDSEGNPYVDTVTVDISHCFEVEAVTVDKCISTVDIQHGLLIIPCVEYNGSYLTVHMDRRGNSDNWEVTFFGNNLDLKHYRRYDDDHYHHYHDDDDDDDDDDD
ncbi:hypothetical protein [Nitrosomonas marina]|uniref:Uncharacterized protein n=1 Tax=Nitrosomonas marina TaxID=917 RepID=A0A1H8H3D4_9PROT|nr:hypothetical protein [Nitrosomonas marina]SEN49988.1 hypothetical protein SAMN05216325_1219 [Nitrosomonas marina]